MTSKFSVIGIVKDHYATLVDDQNPDDGVRKQDLIGFLGVPAALGVGTGALMMWTSFRMQQVGVYIGGVTIFTALLFALVIHVFQLRMNLDQDGRVPPGGRLLTLVNQTFSNVSYAVIVGIGATVLGMVAAAVSPADGVNPYWTGAFVAVGTHLILTIFMCLKRIGWAYGQISKLPRRQPHQHSN